MLWTKKPILALLLAIIATGLFAPFVYAIIKYSLPVIHYKMAPSTTDDVELAATPAFGAHAPTAFTVTYITDYLARLDWTKYPSCNNTMIRVSYVAAPTSVTDGYLVYYGTAVTANDTAINFYQNFGPVYYSAFGDNWTGTGPVSYSSDYAEAELENPAVSDLVNEIGTFNTLLNSINGDWLAYAILIGIAVITILSKFRPLYLAAGFGFVIYGFTYESTSLNFSIILVLVGILLVIGAFAIRRQGARQ